MFRAAQLIRAHAPQEEVRFTQEELRADEDAEYVPWRVLETRKRRGKTEARVGRALVGVVPVSRANGRRRSLVSMSNA